MGAGGGSVLRWLAGRRQVVDRWYDGGLVDGSWRACLWVGDGPLM